jgi:hypothetical protein
MTLLDLALPWLSAAVMAALFVGYISFLSR